jgi:hypothetical protein
MVIRQTVEESDGRIPPRLPKSKPRPSEFATRHPSSSGTARNGGPPPGRGFGATNLPPLPLDYRFSRE